MATRSGRRASTRLPQASVSIQARVEAANAVRSAAEIGSRVSRILTAGSELLVAVRRRVTDVLRGSGEAPQPWCSFVVPTTGRGLPKGRVGSRSGRPELGRGRFAAIPVSTRGAPWAFTTSRCCRGSSTLRAT